ncbi:sulfatase-like hydrolase/transferase [Planctomycetes bacterium CA13]
MLALPLLLLTIASVFFWPGSACADNTKPQPNILLILVDDMGWGDLGVNFQNTRTNPKRHRTPHLDEMAESGVRLAQHYCAAPVCAPSRASLFTGVHQGNAVVRDNQFDWPLENNHTLATVLRSAGYKTWLIGKYGLHGGKEVADEEDQSPANWSAYPTKRGFDEYFGYVRHVDGHQHYPADSWPLGNSPTHIAPKQVWHNDREVSGDLTGCYTADLFTAFTKQAIIDHAKKPSAEPFFMMLAFDTPHAALQLPTMAYPEGDGVDGGMQWIGKPAHMINTASPNIDCYRHPDCDRPDWTDVEQRFATSIRRIDDCVGDLRATLDELGIADNTLIVFTSDNGPHCESYIKDESYKPTSFASYGPFDGIKRDCWEGGIRVPTLACWPGRIEPSVDRRPSQSHDWMPTFADVAGIAAPARTDGVSLIPRWISSNQPDALPSQIYIEYFNGSPTPKYDSFAVNRRGHPRKQMQVVFLDGFKGVRYVIKNATDPFEIYDVASDPSERVNLAGTSPKFIALQTRMQQRVLQLRRPNPSATRPYDDTPVPAMEPASDGKSPPMQLALYRGDYPYVPSVDGLKPERTMVVDEIDTTRLLDFQGAASWSGVIHVDETRMVHFELNSEHKAFLELHQIGLIDADFQRTTATYKESIQLEAGDHPFRLTALIDAKEITNANQNTIGLSVK